MLDFNWGFFWALLAAFAVRGAWRWLTKDNPWVRQHNEQVKERKRYSLD